MLRTLKEWLKYGAYIVAALGAFEYFVDEVEKIDGGKKLKEFSKNQDSETEKSE